MALRIWTTAALTLLAVLALHQQIHAQGMGAGGRSPSGSNLTSGLGFGNATFSNSGMGGGGGLGGGGMSGGGGLGGGGLGGGGLGTGGGFGAGGMGQSGGMGSFGAGGQQQGGFIGRDSAEVTAMFESMGRQGQQNSNNQRRNQNTNRGRDANSGSESIQQQVRVQLRIGFEVPDAASSPMAAALAERLAKVLDERAISDFDFTVANGDVVVTGVAKDDFERMLFSQLLAQQPGVATVKNQMTVAEVIGAPTPRE